jgi:hypothetical protein
MAPSKNGPHFLQDFPVDLRGFTNGNGNHAWRNPGGVFLQKWGSQNLNKIFQRGPQGPENFCAPGTHLNLRLSTQISTFPTVVLVPAIAHWVGLAGTGKLLFLFEGVSLQKRGDTAHPRNNNFNWVNDYKPKNDD